VLSALRADEDHLRSLGFEAQSCLVDFGETAEATLLECLEQKNSIAFLSAPACG
jgi:hypothetical protein